MSQSITVLSRSIIQELVEVQSIQIGVLGKGFDRRVWRGESLKETLQCLFTNRVKPMIPQFEVSCLLK